MHTLFWPWGNWIWYYADITGEEIDLGGLPVIEAVNDDDSPSLTASSESDSSGSVSWCVVDFLSTCL